MSKYYLEPDDINQKSYYKKAYVEIYNNFKLLYSYNTLAAAIINQKIWNNPEDVNMLLEHLHREYYEINNQDIHLKYRGIKLDSIMDLRYIDNPDYNIQLPIIFNIQSATTLKHVKSFLHNEDLCVSHTKQNILNNCIIYDRLC